MEELVERKAEEGKNFSEPGGSAGSRGVRGGPAAAERPAPGAPGRAGGVAL